MGKAKHDYRQSGCGVAYGLDVFGDKWTLVVVRDMIMWGKRHFNELLASREKMASNILADRRHPGKRAVAWGGGDRTREGSASLLKEKLLLLLGHRGRIERSDPRKMEKML
jgi:hypothetical protein